MTDWRNLPSLNRLKGFAAYAKAGTVARAGAELAVSHVAISQKIRQLEGHLGLARVSRASRELVTAAQGQIWPMWPDGAGIAFRHGNGDWPGLRARLLVNSTIEVVEDPPLISPEQVRSVLQVWPNCHGCKSWARPKQPHF